MNSLSNDTAGRRLAWAFLSSVADGPSQFLSELLQDMGPVEAARAVLDDDPADGTRSLSAVGEHLVTVEHLGGRLVTPDDAEWPAHQLVPYTSALRPDPVRLAPLSLWVLGARMLPELLERAVAVTGTRASSGYGSHITGSLVADLADAGYTTVAGAAFGVDAAAHRAALATGAPTVAVLPCGLDVAYPHAHSALLREIAATGAIVTEHPPGTPASRTRLAARQRLLAAFARAVVVPEAGLRSGARAVAAHAQVIGRPTFAMPGPVTSAASAGCHDLIRTGQARLAVSAADVLEVLDPAPAGPTDGDTAADAR